jgi:hypothetical protein
MNICFKISKHLFIYSYFLSHNCLPVQQWILIKEVSTYSICLIPLSQGEYPLFELLELSD